MRLRRGLNRLPNHTVRLRAERRRRLHVPRAKYKISIREPPRQKLKILRRAQKLAQNLTLLSPLDCRRKPTGSERLPSAWMQLLSDLIQLKISTTMPS